MIKIIFSYFLLFIMLSEMALVTLIMSRFELRAAKCEVGGKLSEEEIASSLVILQFRRRLCLVIDLVTTIAVIIGLWIGTSLVVIIARFAH